MGEKKQTDGVSNPNSYHMLKDVVFCKDLKKKCILEQNMFAFISMHGFFKYIYLSRSETISERQSPFQRGHGVVSVTSSPSL